MSVGISARNRGDAEEQPHTNGKAHCGEVEDGLPKMNASLADASQSLTIQDVDRVEKLLAQLEARSMAMVPYACGLHVPQIRPAAQLNKALIAGTLISLWLSTLVAAVTLFRVTKYGPQMVEQDPVATLRVIPKAHEVQQPTSAVQASPMSTLSRSLNRLADRTEHANKDLLRTTANVNGVSEILPRSKINLVVRSVPLTMTTARPRFWDPLLDVKPTESAIAHRSAEGAIDYWVLPHGPFFSDPTKVLPLGRSPNGVYVRNLDDGRNYRVTPSGDWYIMRISSEK